jgi:hypothetical protein
MQDSKKDFVPMSHGVSLCKSQCPSTSDEQEKMSVIPYASAIGSIMYAMLCICPDIAYTLSVQVDTSQTQERLTGLQPRIS